MTRIFICYDLTNTELLDINMLTERQACTSGFTLIFFEGPAIFLSQIYVKPYPAVLP